MTQQPLTDFVDPQGKEPTCRFCGKLSHSIEGLKACLTKLKETR